ncbi:DNA-binding MarR family transcriptional regulator [Pullulanibacillus pueri]|uniref:MarR family transcriptional regulator n=1 Tax=Pullulanibacillus pueri TaxID=1437324 RepID=A0A8J2ZWA9_9BACL|nr:MarR family transcriptional regulator [Pullulanibacillus pueri]MBM7682817.1 DNA-binding MarR family transcriptional regulator [Pullulanibacillus pueri]GGH83302.1 MarR family transcriptional regulator [Pullulanibacillus pueri]
MDGFERIKVITRSFRELYHALWLLGQVEELDITGIQLFVLSAVAKEPNLSLGELAEMMQTNNSTMSGIVDRLVKADLIVRERSEKDRRTLTMRITPLGEEKRKQAKKYVQERLSGLANMKDEDISLLLKLHQDILDKIHLEGDGKKDDESK